MRKRKSFVKYTGRACCVGIMGMARSVGTTHLAMMMANGCANGLGLRTAVMEYNNHRDFMKICGEGADDREDLRHFSYGGIDFYGAGTKETIVRILNEPYEILILDMDYEFEECFYEFFRCDVRIAVGSTAKWRIGKSCRIFSRKPCGKFYMAAFMPDRKEKKRLERTYMTVLKEIPAERDPFKLTPQNLEWLETFLDSTGTF